MRLEACLDSAHLLEGALRAVAEVFDSLSKVSAHRSEAFTNVAAETVKFTGDGCRFGLGGLDCLHLVEEPSDVSSCRARRLLELADLPNGPEPQFFNGAGRTWLRFVPIRRVGHTSGCGGGATW